MVRQISASCAAAQVELVGSARCAARHQCCLLGDSNGSTVVRLSELIAPQQRGVELVLTSQVLSFIRFRALIVSCVALHNSIC